MLSIFRRGVTAKIMLVILGIGLFAIVVTGFGTGGGGLGDMTGQSAGTIVSVGDEQIGARDVTRQVNRQVERGPAGAPGLRYGRLRPGRPSRPDDRPDGSASPRRSSSPASRASPRRGR
jgi:hypothetical protein